MPRHDPGGRLIGRSDRGKAAVAKRESVADLLQQVMREGMRVGELQADEIIGRLPIGILVADMVHVILRFLFGRATDHMAEGQHSDLAALRIGPRPERRDLFFRP